LTQLKTTIAEIVMLDSEQAGDDEYGVDLRRLSRDFRAALLEQIAAVGGR
jgi:hypothetical protein